MLHQPSLIRAVERLTSSQLLSPRHLKQTNSHWANCDRPGAPCICHQLVGWASGRPRSWPASLRAIATSVLSLMGWTSSSWHRRHSERDAVHKSFQASSELTFWRHGVVLRHVCYFSNWIDFSFHLRLSLYLWLRFDFFWHRFGFHLRFKANRSMLNLNQCLHTLQRALRKGILHLVLVGFCQGFCLHLLQSCIGFCQGSLQAGGKGRISTRKQRRSSTPTGPLSETECNLRFAGTGASCQCTGFSHPLGWLQALGKDCVFANFSGLSGLVSWILRLLVSNCSASDCA